MTRMSQAELLRATLGRRRQLERRAAARTQLEKLARVHGGGRMSRSYFPSRGPTSGDPADATAREMLPGQFDVQYGQAPTDIEVDRFMAATGMRPTTMAQAMRQQANLQRRGGPIRGVRTPDDMAGGGGAGGATSGGALQTFLDEQKAAADRAREENLKRYNEAHGLLSDIRPRNLERVDAFKRDQQMLNKRAFDEFLLQARSNAERMGNSNSSQPWGISQRQLESTQILDAGINAQRAALASDVDTRDTNNLVGVIERREDRGSDANLTAQVAMQMGQQGLAEKQLASDERRDKLRLALEERMRKDQRRAQLGLYGAFGAPRTGGYRGPIFVGPQATGIPAWATGGFPLMGRGGQQPMAAPVAPAAPPVVAAQGAPAAPPQMFMGPNGPQPFPLTPLQERVMAARAAYAARAAARRRGVTGPGNRRQRSKQILSPPPLQRPQLGVPQMPMYA